MLENIAILQFTTSDSPHFTFNSTRFFLLEFEPGLSLPQVFQLAPRPHPEGEGSDNHIMVSRIFFSETFVTLY